MAYQEGVVGLHAPIKVRRTVEVDGKPYTGIINATVGRIIFNDPIPQDLGYVDRSTPESMLELEINFLVKKKQLGQIIDRCIKVHGTPITADVLDKVKAQGFKYSTKGAFDRGRGGCHHPGGEEADPCRFRGADRCGGQEVPPRSHLQ